MRTVTPGATNRGLGWGAKAPTGNTFYSGSLPNATSWLVNLGSGISVAIVVNGEPGPVRLDTRIWNAIGATGPWLTRDLTPFCG